MNTSEQDTPSINKEDTDEFLFEALNMRNQNKLPNPSSLKKSDSIELDENAGMSQSGLFYKIRSQIGIYRVD